MKKNIKIFYAQHWIAIYFVKISFMMVLDDFTIDWVSRLCTIWWEYKNLT